MHIGIVQGIMLALMVFGLGIALAKHGQDKGKYSFGISFVDFCITLSLLYFGGFFK